MNNPSCPFKDVHNGPRNCDLEDCPMYYGHVLVGKKLQGVCANPHVLRYAKEQQKQYDNERYRKACERGKLDV